MVKTHPPFGILITAEMNCVAANEAMRFSVRSFGCALFILGGDCMADYKKMYITLCAAVDKAIDQLEKLPCSAPQTMLLKNALLEAEEIYIQTEEKKRS